MVSVLYALPATTMGSAHSRLLAVWGAVLLTAFVRVRGLANLIACSLHRVEGGRHVCATIYVHLEHAAVMENARESPMDAARTRTARAVFVTLVRKHAVAVMGTASLATGRTARTVQLTAPAVLIPHRVLGAAV